MNIKLNVRETKRRICVFKSATHVRLEATPKFPLQFQISLNITLVSKRLSAFSEKSITRNDLNCNQAASSCTKADYSLASKTSCRPVGIENHEKPVKEYHLLPLAAEVLGN